MAEEEASWDQSLEEWLISEAWSAEIWTLNMLEDAKNTKSSYSHWSNSSQHLNIQTTFLAFWQCCEVPDIRQLMAQIKSGPPGKLCCDMDSPLMNHNTDGYTEHENAIAFWAILSLTVPDILVSCSGHRLAVFSWYCRYAQYLLAERFLRDLLEHMRSCTKRCIVYRIILSHGLYRQNSSTKFNLSIGPAIPEGYCYAAGMAQLEDGAFYAAAPQEGEVRGQICLTPNGQQVHECTGKYVSI